MATDSISVAGTRPDNRPVNARDNDKASDSPSAELFTGDEESHPSSGKSREPQQRDEQQEERPPLPEEDVPPLPAEAPPAAAEDDGWAPVWDDNAQAYYFYNRFTAQSQWSNPRVPSAQQDTAPGVGNHDRIAATPADERPPSRPHGGYDPAIHGDYDPTASYAREAGTTTTAQDASSEAADPNAIYTATGVFNRFTGKWQPATLAPENFNDENKSKRQMSAFFDVDAAANSHNGKSLKAERSGKKLTKQELKSFKEKRREKKEEKRRAWLRD